MRLADNLGGIFTGNAERSSSTERESLTRTMRRNEEWQKGFFPQGATSMLGTREQSKAIRTLGGWAIHVLQEVGAIHECEEHGWAKERGDPHARERAMEMARKYPPAGVSADDAAREVRDVLDSMGDKCPECPDGEC